jgi:hypothetical protein
MRSSSTGAPLATCLHSMPLMYPGMTRYLPHSP